MTVYPHNIKDCIFQILGIDDRPINGTGFVCNDEGYIITCYHVLTHERSTLPNIVRLVSLTEKNIVAHVCPDLCSAENDIAVLKTDSQITQYLPLDTYCRWGVGDLIHSYGYINEYSNLNPIRMMGKINDETIITLPNQKNKSIQVGTIGINTNHASFFGYSGSPIISDLTSRVIGLFHSIDGNNCFFIPIGKIFNRWKNIEEFHDVINSVRLSLSITFNKLLEVHLRDSKYIPLKLEMGLIEQNNADPVINSARLGVWGHNRKWKECELNSLIPPNDSFFLSSSVGTGKTTQLMWLAREINNIKECISLFLPCKIFNEDIIYRSQMDLLNLCVNRFLTDIQTNNNKFICENDVFFAFKKQFEEHKLLFLFDGFDQISVKNPHDFFYQVKKIINYNNSILSSRPSSLLEIENDIEKKFLRLMPFSDEDEKQFFGSYYLQSRQICSLSPELTKIPMLAYMIKKIIPYLKGLNLNGIECLNRAELYQKFLDVILIDQNMQIKNHDEINETLWYVSFINLQKEPPAIQKIPINSNFNSDLLIKTGLLNIIYEYGESSSSKHNYLFFTHQSFQEFFAAEYINHLDDPNPVIKSIIDEHRKPKWKEVIRFLTGLRGSEIIEKILQHSDYTDYSELLLASEMLKEVQKKDMVLWKKIYSEINCKLNVPTNKNLIIKRINALGMIGSVPWLPKPEFDKVSEDIYNYFDNDDNQIRRKSEDNLKLIASRLSKKIICDIVDQLANEEPDIRESAIDTLDNIIKVKKIKTNIDITICKSIVNKIVEMLDDLDGDTTVATSTALINHCELITEKNIRYISHIMEFGLFSHNRIDATETLERMNCDIPEKIIEDMISSLDSRHIRDPDYVKDVLKKINDKQKLSESIIEKIKQVL